MRSYGPRPVRLVPRLDRLESRQMLTGTPGVDYALSGSQWANPTRITYSIAPDGVAWDHGLNSLNAAFDARFGQGVWEKALARALATWESVAEIDIANVADGPFNLNALGKSQGDARFGDIRFGGYAFPDNTTTLAQTYYPPPNGSTEAGDVNVNIGIGYNNGADFDLYSVMLHETGHALGLNHASNPASVMNETYRGVRDGLSPGDIAGIQAVYGARGLDAYRSRGLGGTPASAVDATPALSDSGVAVLRDASLSAVGDTGYFKVVVPQNSTGGLRVAAVAAGISLLSPKVTILDASGREISTGSNPSAWGGNVTAYAPGVVPGQTYTVAVTGATSDAFAVGSFALGMVFDGVTPAPVRTPDPTPPAPAPAPVAPTPAPVVTPAPAPLSPVVPADRFESVTAGGQAAGLGVITKSTVIGGLTLNTSGDVDRYVWQTARAGTYAVAAPAPGTATHVRIYDATGRTLAEGTGILQFRAARPRTRVFVEVRAETGQPVAGYSLVIAPVPAAASRPVTRGTPRAAAFTAPEIPPAATPAWAAAWSKARGR